MDPNTHAHWPRTSGVTLRCLLGADMVSIETLCEAHAELAGEATTPDKMRALLVELKIPEDKIDFKAFRSIADEVNAYLLAKVKKYNYCSISILCDEKSFLDFSMTKEAKKKMIDHGYKAVEKKYNNFVKKKFK